MNLIKKYLLFFLMFLALVSCKNNNLPFEGATEEKMEIAYRIPAGENSWASQESGRRSGPITQEGVKNWSNLENKITSFFRTENSGKLQLGLKIKAASGPATLKIIFAEETKEISIDNSQFEDITIGTYALEKPGYHSVEIIPVDKTGKTIVDIEEILVGGPATQAGVNFVEDNFHFGRRGPSVHLRYEYPEEKEVLYFYNEIEVPEGEDVIGSYFMANGFSHGYFGIQVNSLEERRILFSVWSPYETQDPNEIPEDYRINLLKKGEDVYTGEFGNEGSGGQSYLKYMWKPDTTYKFLLKGEPAGNNSTDYTAYFYAPEKKAWELIASFKRPHTDSYLGNFYSFLENFVPSTGDISRKAFYKNQWVYTKNGKWIESTKARFTADATAGQKHRLDYAGGVEGNSYFMKNCGFFDDYTKVNTILEREPNNQEPIIDFQSLP
ncbi:DUF3472 domain-containing protein [Antarcticibacterium sp. 1MA-6-2]|uniref:DUF3472 domain-containing protein n=1 Tax=Antarcticibacterium sp. 1MA-6-2 TaxID=2908210 RepID=UPI001F240648|nr:DUF3472 domain-containing protein [Antarcticibacterium sp. 1MA-6-2]UJH90178.1 DUF3472 domain-containing protein [Antarcticibacterium sp. 1MA-6-2]